MMARRVDYDSVAGTYERRYDQHDYAGVQHTVLAFAAGEATAAVLEVGCGTGHWLATLGDRAAVIAGVDPSWGMLQRARLAAPGALLARGRAEALPWRAASFDRVVCINALHHFADPVAFFGESRRVLRPGGGLLVVGLDPHTGLDRWWVYDYFPSALAADRTRYPATQVIRHRMAEAGFGGCETQEAQHLPAALPVRAAADRGLLERSSTSQLMVIPDEEYHAGVARIRAARPGAGEREPTLRADLRLYATTGWLPGSIAFGLPNEALKPTGRHA